MSKNMLKKWPTLNTDEQNKIRDCITECDISQILMMSRLNVAETIRIRHPLLACKVCPWLPLRFYLKSAVKTAAVLLIVGAIVGFHLLCWVGLYHLGQQSPWWYLLVLPYLALTVAGINLFVCFSDPNS